jgi:hypothetical protein
MLQQKILVVDAGGNAGDVPHHHQEEHPQQAFGIHACRVVSGDSWSGYFS